MPMATFVPLAHAGHWLWVLYLPPVAVVVFSIVKSTLSERRAEREERAGGGEEKSER
jgi:hypothetical protein